MTNQHEKLSWSICNVPLELDAEMKARAEKNRRSFSAQVIADLEAVTFKEFWTPRARGKAATTSANRAGRKAGTG